MGPEANIDLIRVLEKQIEEGNGDIIKLKRDRNSLLNISIRIPPEILGYIFAQCLIREWASQELQKGSYKFLLVCHHWFEVASDTPELWSFWGVSFRDWKKRHHRSAATPLDLVYNGYKRDPTPFDESLQDAIRSRVMQNTIRSVHLVTDNLFALMPIISSLIPDDGGDQNENIESIYLHYTLGTCTGTLDVSAFFTRSRLPRLRSLGLFGDLYISSWDHLLPRTTLLTSLSLVVDASTPPPRPTAAQLCSILSSNPNLQELKLSGDVLPDNTDTPTLTVPLPHLKMLSLTGELHRLFGLLRQLILPEMLDDLYLIGSDFTVVDVSQTLAPYMRDYFQRDPRFQNPLEVSTSQDSTSIKVTVAGAPGIASSQREPPRASLTIFTYTPLYAPERLLVDLITLIPLERVVSFHARVDIKLPEDLFCMMPNIEILRLSGQMSSRRFLQPNRNGSHANTKLLPSLRSLRLENPGFLGDNEWGHLKTYLAHRTSDNQAISLEVIGKISSGPPEIVNEIRRLVKQFIHR